MTIKHRLISLMVCAFAAWPAMAETHSDTSRPPLAAGNNAFAYTLYAQINGSRGNLCFSPFGASSALAMAYAGAAGDTATQMRKVLHFPATQGDTHAGFAALLKHFDQMRRGDSVQLEMANSIWPQQGRPLLASYLTLVKQNYGVSITPVDYRQTSAVAQISRWVREKTHGEITDILRPLSSDTRMALVNAAYFKGDWATPFKHERTENAPFFIDGARVRIPLMAQTGPTSYAESAGMQIIRLPYRGHEISMYVILPSDKTLAGLLKLENKLSPEQVAQWQAQMHETTVDVFLPKFKLDCGVGSLAGPLQKLGLRNAFDLSKADFSRINGSSARNGDAEGLYISDVVQKVRIAVDEQGTEAAAATAVVAVAAGVAPEISSPPPVFRADHPFLFLIVDHATESVLFMGRVVDPSGQWRWR